MREDGGKDAGIVELPDVEGGPFRARGGAGSCKECYADADANGPQACAMAYRSLTNEADMHV